jgi:hypothetical protein
MTKHTPEPEIAAEMIKRVLDGKKWFVTLKDGSKFYADFPEEINIRELLWCMLEGPNPVGVDE